MDTKIDEKTGLKIVEAPKLDTTVEIPKEVENKEFSVEDFDVQQLPEQESGAEQEQPSVKPKVEEKAKEEEAKEEEGEKIGEKEEVEEKAPFDGVLKKPNSAKGSDTKPITPQKTTRDYSGFNESEVKALKAMSNDAFEFATKTIKENRELAKLKDTQYLQHEKAYTLSPEFNELNQNARLASFEEQYWRQQLVKMDAGQDLVPLQGYDKKTGQPVYGTPIRASKELEEEVRQTMYNASQTAQQMRSQVQEFPNKYKGQLQQDLSFLENYRNQQFAWVTDPTMLDHTLEIGGQTKSLKAIREEVSNILPSYMRNHPLAGVLSDLVIAVQVQKAQLSQYESRKHTASVKKEEADLIEPSSKAKGQQKSKGTPVHGMTEFAVDPDL